MIHKNYCNIIMINGNLTSAPVFSTWVVVGGGVQYKQRDNRNFIVHQAYIVYPLNKYPPGLLYQLPCCCIRCPQYDIQAPLLFCGPSMRHDLYHNSMYPTYHPLLTCSKSRYSSASPGPPRLCHSAVLGYGLDLQLCVLCLLYFHQEVLYPKDLSMCLETEVDSL